MREVLERLSDDFHDSVTGSGGEVDCVWPTGAIPLLELVSPRGFRVEGLGLADVGAPLAATRFRALGCRAELRRDAPAHETLRPVPRRRPRP